MLEIHIRGLRVGAEGRDQHHIIGVEDEQAQNDHEAIQQTAEQRMLNCAEAKLDTSKDRHQHTGQNRPQRVQIGKAQILQRRVDVFSCRAAEQEAVQLGEQRLLALRRYTAAVQGDTAGEGIGIGHKEYRNQQKRSQRQQIGGASQRPCPAVQQSV